MTLLLHLGGAESGVRIALQNPRDISDSDCLTSHPWLFPQSRTLGNPGEHRAKAHMAITYM
ncbi:hypothetical protein E2C01_035000 [Portunus trituberculatus]|uniref:Uncharacterized protein n=1 Tax=Portunus trituberculatus TaxID=210409 RepID=A0A5B7F210_PORTR|nr:hypothetical protein [Portunus trituberculatus]